MVVLFALGNIRLPSKELLMEGINKNNIHKDVWLGSEEEQNFIVEDDITEE